MSVLLRNFTAEAPIRDSRLLPEGAATYAVNVRTRSGALKPIKLGTVVKSGLSTATKRVFRIPYRLSDFEDYADSYYIAFDEADTDVVRSPLVDDHYERYYIASPALAEPVYNTKARLIAGSANYVLGIPSPAAPTVTQPSGGTLVTRAYVVTWVSAYGEEGPPSPPTLKTGNQTGTWAIGLTPPDVGVSSVRNLTHANIYRTITSSTGVATYFYVGQVTIATTAYNDTAADSLISANNQLESSQWTAPPALQGIVSMPNGILAGFHDNELWFSEPYRPHAWPASYALGVEKPIIGLGVVGQTCVVMTSGHTYLVSGVTPSSMGMVKMVELEPCMARGSIVSTQEGVFYVSQSGLIQATSSGMTNITAKIIDRGQWQDKFNLKRLRAARYEGMYLASGTTYPGVFLSTAFENTAFEMGADPAAPPGPIIDFSENGGLSEFYFGGVVDGMHADYWTGDPTVIVDGVVYIMKAITTSNPAPELPYLWTSKVFHTPNAVNYSCARVVFETYSTTPAQNPVGNDTLVQSLAAGQYGLLRVYANGVHVATREIRESDKIIRLPSGFKATQWQFSIEGIVELKHVQVARTVKDLARGN